MKDKASINEWKGRDMRRDRVINKNERKTKKQALDQQISLEQLPCTVQA